MILEGKPLEIIDEIKNKIKPIRFWEPKIGKNVTLYFINSQLFLINKKYQNQFLELYNLLNEDNAMLIENLLTNELFVIAFPLDARKLLISLLFKEENYETLNKIKNNFQNEINEYLQTL